DFAHVFRLIWHTGARHSTIWDTQSAAENFTPTRKQGVSLGAAGNRSRPGHMRSASGQCREHRRQLHAKYRAAGLCVVAHDLPAVLLQDSVADAKPKPRSFADGFRGVEGIEYTMRFADSRPGIRKENHDVGAIAQRADGQHTSAGLAHGVQTVIDDVKKDLHELVVISPHTRQNGFELHVNARTAAVEVERAQLHRACDTELMSSNVRSGGTWRAK